MIKKLTAILLILSLAFTMTSCGPNYKKIKITKDEMNFDATPDEFYETFHLLSSIEIKEGEIQMMTDGSEGGNIWNICINGTEDKERFQEILKTVIQCLDFKDNNAEKKINEFIAEVEAVPEYEKELWGYTVYPKENINDIAYIYTDAYNLNGYQSFIEFFTSKSYERMEEYYPESIQEELKKNPRYPLPPKE